MSSISSLSSSYLPSTPSPKIGAFDQNTKNFGPAAATAIGLADAAGSAIGTTYSFSHKALDDFAAVGNHISDAIGGAANAVGSVVDGIEHGASAVAHGISNLAHEAVSGVEDATHVVLEDIRGAARAVENTVGGAASAVTGAVNSVVSGIGSTVSNLGNYAALGLGAGKSYIDEIV